VIMFALAGFVVYVMTQLVRWVAPPEAQS